MSAESTLVRDENTSAPFIGVVVFSGGYDYVIVGTGLDEDSLPSQDQSIETYVNTTGIEEDDLTLENYKEISLMGLTGQGVAVDDWTVQKNRASAKKILKALLTEVEKSYVSPETKDFQSLLVSIASEARDGGLTYEDEETGAEDMDTEYLVRTLIDNIDPDGPDGWRIKHLITD